ncbi:MAG: DMT family transporter, partial [Pseudomonadota bacterium]
MTSPLLSKPHFGAGLMIAAGLMFALVNTGAQHATMRLGVPSASFAFWQYLVAFLFFVPWLLGRASAFRTRRIGLHVLRVAFAAIGVQLWVLGLAHVPIWQAIALIMLSPFFVAFGAAVLLGEAATLARWLAVSLGFAGGMIVLAPWSDAFSWAAFLPVAAAMFWACASLLTKYMTATESAETLTVYLLALLIPVNGLALLGQGGGLPAGGLWVIVVAGVLTAAAQFALAQAYAL